VVFGSGQLALWENCASCLCLGLEAEYKADRENEKLKCCSHSVLFLAIRFDICGRLDINDAIFAGPVT
jgi:hypothetical protein